MKLTYPVRLIQALVRERKKARTRSPKWTHVRREHLIEHSRCAACGGKRLLQVHHKEPFAKRPELELEPSNLITLCVGLHECHLDLGHGGDWDHLNPRVAEDAVEFLHNRGRARRMIKKRAAVLRVPSTALAR